MRDWKDQLDLDKVELKPPFVEGEVRKNIPVYRGVLQYFPDAIKEVSKTSYAATKQHHPDKEMFWDRTKSNDHYDAMIRHLLDHEGEAIDDDGQLHLAKVAWRALAGLQTYLETIKIK